MFSYSGSELLCAVIFTETLDDLWPFFLKDALHYVVLAGHKFYTGLRVRARIACENLACMRGLIGAPVFVVQILPFGTSRSGSQGFDPQDDSIAPGRLFKGSI